MPDVQTVSEYGSSLDTNGVIGSSWHGIFAPSNTPDAVLSRLNTEIVKIIKLPEVQDRMRGLGLAPTGTSASLMASTLASDYAFWGQLVRDLAIKVE